MSAVVGAYSEEQVTQLTGVSRRQLQSWSRTGFFAPSYHGEGRQFARIYSFRDLVSLRVLNNLRNVNNVSMHELRKTAVALRKYGEDAWTKLKLRVFRGKVVFTEPETGKLREVTGAQYIAEICIDVEIGNTLEDVRRLNERTGAVVGQIARNRFVNHRAWVVAGTRIPVAAIKSFHEAGYSIAAIRDEYPDLTEDDVRAAIHFDAGRAA